MYEDYDSVEINFFNAYLKDIDKPFYQNVANRMENSQSYRLLQAKMKRDEKHRKVLTGISTVIAVFYGVFVARYLIDKDLLNYSLETFIAVSFFIILQFIYTYIVWRVFRKVKDNSYLINVTLNDNIDALKQYYKEFVESMIDQEVVVTDFSIAEYKENKQLHKQQIHLVGTYQTKNDKGAAIIKLGHINDLRTILAIRYLSKVAQ